MPRFIFDNVEDFFKLKVLIVDRDRNAANILHSAMTELGHEVHVEPAKEAAIELHRQELFNLIMIDPAPQNDLRQFITAIRRVGSQNNHNTYIIMLSHDKTRKEAFTASANYFIQKPVVRQDLKEVAWNVLRMASFYNAMQAGEFNREIGGVGPVMSRASITQVFLSCVDRADRYGETSALMSIHWHNADSVLQEVGQEKTHEIRKALHNFIVKIRRRSDLLGRLNYDQYTLIMQRFPTENEPPEALKRFGESLKDFITREVPPEANMKIKLEMIHMPTGAKVGVVDVARD